MIKIRMEQQKKQISENLNGAKFMLARSNRKEPINKWKENPLSYEEVNKKLQEDHNVGLISDGLIFGIDADSIELEQAIEGLLPKTHCEESKRGKHYFFKFKGDDSNLPKITNVEHNGKHLGEIRLKDSYTLVYPSIVGGFEYKIIHNRPLAEVTKEQLQEVLKQFYTPDLVKSQIKSSELPDLVKEDSEIMSLLEANPEVLKQFPSRSEAEQSLVNKLVARNFSKEEVFGIMAHCKIGRWLERPLDYRNRTFEKAIQYVTTQKASSIKEELPLWNVQDYKNYKVPKQNFLIKDYLRKAENSMLYAPSGFFKSIFALYLAICIASGRKVLNKFKTKRALVIYISAENSIKTDKERICKIMKGLRIRKNIPLYFLPRKHCEDIMSPEFQAKLYNSLKKTKAELIILDTINPLTPEIEDNKARDVTAFFNKFVKPINDFYKCHVMFLHHTGKDERSYLGSVKWKANTDNLFRLERKDLKNVFRIFNEKNREGEEKTLEIMINFDGLIKFFLLSESDPAIFSKRKKMTQEEFFLLKLKELVHNKKTERKEIFKIFRENKIKFAEPTLDRTLKKWRMENG